jgi:hypothetical protein
MTNEDKQQTAVEWFYEEIWKQFGFSCSSNILEKAKEIEKQQIMDAHGIQMKGVNNHKCITGEQYYNKIFKQD